MFSALGGKIARDKTAFKEFKQLFGKKFQDYLGLHTIYFLIDLLPLSYKPTDEPAKSVTLFRNVADRMVNQYQNNRQSIM